MSLRLENTKRLLAVGALDEPVNAFALMLRTRVCAAQRVAVAARLWPLRADFLMDLEISARCDARAIKARDRAFGAFGVGMVWHVNCTHRCGA
jgi:hypothetical protein